MFLSLPKLTWTAIALGLLATSGLSACTRSESSHPLTASDAWVRLSPPNSRMTAAYGTFKNTGSETLVLSGFSSPQFGDVTLHYTEDVNGTATMREASVQTLAPGESLLLQPGGFHLMLMQRKVPTPEGYEVELTVELKSGSASKHVFVVSRR